MRVVLALTAFTLAGLAACSSSDGGIEPDPAGVASTTTTVATGGDASTGSGSGSGSGVGGGAPDQNRVSNFAWALFQGEFDSDDQEPEYEGAVVPPPRRLVGCAVVASELGDRVVYLERTDPASEGPPDRQLVISFSSAPAEELAATGKVYRPVDPTEWAGQCEAGETLQLVGPVAADEGCTLTLNRNDSNGQVNMWATEPLAASCFVDGSGAAGMKHFTTAYASSIHWLDELYANDGTMTRDPAADTSYIMSRRSELPPIPGE